MPIPSFIFPAAPPVSSSAIFALDVFADKPVFQPESASFTRATTATRTNSSGLIEEVSSGIARVDWSVGGEPNTLLEPQRTNLVIYSEKFDNWSFIGATANPNVSASPDGYQSADEIIGDGSSTNVRTYIGLSTSAGVNTFSVFLKSGNTNFAYIEFSGFGGITGTTFAYFDLANGTTPTSGANIEDYGNGWYRCSISATIDASDISGNVSFRATPNIFASSFPTACDADGKYVLAWGAQLEVGAYATSYIPTTSTSVTRNADSFTLSNVYTSGKITDAGGTWFVEIRGNVALTRDANVPNFLFISNNSSGGGLGANVLAIGNVGFTNSRMYIFKLINGAYTQLAATTTTTIKIAIKWNGSTADVFVNGVKVVTNTAFTTTNMEFLVGNGTDVPKYINSMALYPTPLLDYQCEMLTGLKFNTYNEMAGYYNYTIQ